MARNYYKHLRRSRIAGHFEDPLSTKQSVSREPQPRNGAAMPALYISKKDREGNLVDGWYFRPNKSY